MNSLEFEALKIRIVTRLQNIGATRSETLAAEMDVPHGNVRLALEQLFDARETPIQRLPFGLWDLKAEERAA
jgi:hypothetical protein